jgi:hypothetical protein
MGREEEHDIATLLFWEFLESNFDVLGDSLAWRQKDMSGYKGGSGGAHLNKSRMCTPTINDAPIDTRKHPGFALSINVIKTATRRATAVLRVLCKRYRVFHAILLHTPCSLVCQGMCIAECDVALVRCCRRVELVQ